MTLWETEKRQSILIRDALFLVSFPLRKWASSRTFYYKLLVDRLLRWSGEKHGSPMTLKNLQKYELFFVITFRIAWRPLRLISTSRTFLNQLEVRITQNVFSKLHWDTVWSSFKNSQIIRDYVPFPLLYLLMPFLSLTSKKASCLNQDVSFFSFSHTLRTPYPPHSDRFQIKHVGIRKARCSEEIHSSLLQRSVLTDTWNFLEKVLSALVCYVTVNSSMWGHVSSTFWTWNSRNPSLLTLFILFTLASSWREVRRVRKWPEKSH